MVEIKIEGFAEIQEMLKEYREGGALELQQYRAIGTVKYFKECADILNKTATDELAKIIDEWILYHKIGTVEECREARERQRVKDIIHNPDGGVDEDWLCPSCGRFCSPYTKHCQHCGQAVKVGDNL